ncbi:xaa-Pro aminopeptidase 1-like isoform X2 [Ptychodera flava]|uniref:xaa-Pro aminopeptidase 1-like isoform X2 n=1 Tax=Ptychodera flava TaxID=63121 RepID=UPI00396A3B84
MAGKSVLFMIFLVYVTLCTGYPEVLLEGSNRFRSDSVQRVRREGDEIPDTQRDCTDPDNPKYPPTTVHTGERLEELREEMEKYEALAYIVPSTDSHYGASCHKRRHWITGMSGSDGLAIVTTDEAAMWTDGRYFLQSEQQLDCNWQLMREGEPETPTEWDWLIDVLPSGTAENPTRVAFDPTVMSFTMYNTYKDAFDQSSKHIAMYSIETNLVDEIWTDRPECPNEPLHIMDVKWAGQEWWDKIKDVRDEMQKVDVDMLVLHALDDTAWLLNMRGADIPNSPVFSSYTILTLEETILYIINVDKLVTDVPEIRDHLKRNDQTAVCADPQQNHQCLDIREYDTFLGDLNNEADKEGINKVWISDYDASYGIYGNVDEAKHYSAAVPIRIMKAVKNENEIEGMKEGNLQDAVALIEFLHWIENAMEDGEEITEMSAADKAESFRKDQPDYVMKSFNYISAFGPNAAVIHYTPSEETDSKITKENLYLLDSGGQYKCGTTVDTTRTMHYGSPQEIHKQAYTRVLMGAIDLSLSIFPEGTYGRDIDVHARQPLWDYGWDYRHGTGHGIGAMLNVHEGPNRIYIGCRKGQAPLEYGMFSSDEPGYYEDNEYGVRLETVFMVIDADTPHNFGDLKYFTFEEVAFVPFEPKLIKYEMMSLDQLNWLNDYHQKVREKVGPRLSQKNQDAYDWMIRQTEPVPVPYSPPTDGAQTIFANVILLMTVTVVSIFNNFN